MRIGIHYEEMRGFLKESWALGWPMILMMFFQFSIGIADVYVAGFLGTDILAAVGYVAQLYWTLVILANAITVGAVSMVSQAYGAKSSQGVGNITANALIMGVWISGALTILAQLFPAAIVRLAGMPSGIQEIAESFIKVFSLVLIPTYVMIITGGILRSSGRVRVAMINSCAAALATVAGDLVLGLGWGLPFPGFGYLGIAWATAIGTTSGMVLNLLHIVHGPGRVTLESFTLGIAWAAAIRTTLGMVLNLIHIVRGPGRVPLESFTHPAERCIRNLIRLGVPSALQQIAWNAGTLVVYFLVGRLEGGQITALAAMTAGVRIEAIIFLPIFALNMAAAVLTGNRLGMHDVAGARSGAKATATLSLAITLLPALAIFVFAPALSSLLTEDPGVLDEMTRYLRINMIGMPFLALGVTLSGALQGAGDTFGTMRIIFIGMWLLRIPLILGVVYVLRTSATGIWWAMTVSIVLMCLMLIQRFRGDAWTRASIDKKSNSMLWEACLGKESDQTGQESPKER